jgi:copper chaperone CopZ
MSCPTCREQLNEALAIRGGSSIHVQVDEGVVAVDHDTSVSAERLICALQGAGYAAARQSPS